MLHAPDSMTDTATAQPRAIGDLVLSSKARDGVSAIDRLRTSGCLKALFPRNAEAVESILINTSGGLTSGDRLTFRATAGPESRMVLTTQAAERAYRAAGGFARVDSHVSVAQGARMQWLPQELIVFEGARLSRRLRVDLRQDAELLLVEPVIFGRRAMGERVRDAHLQDRIEIWRDGAPLYCDTIDLAGDVEARLGRSALGAGAAAMACLVYVGPKVAGHLAALRSMLPLTGGASALRDDVLVARVVAPDGFALRRFLLPALDRLSGSGLPVSWRL